MSQPVVAGNGDVGFASGTQFATDNVAGTEYPISKIDVGGAGVSAPLSATNPMPVAVQGTNDVGDRVGRLLGVIASITAAIDVGDRAARLLGHVTVDNLPANAAQEAGGNLAAIAAKDFATGAKQDSNLAAIVTLDTDLKAEIGVVGASPGAYTVLDRLSMNTTAINNLAKSVASEATMQKLLAALSKPASKSYSTLLHR